MLTNDAAGRAEDRVADTTNQRSRLEPEPKIAGVVSNTKAAVAPASSETAISAAAEIAVSQNGSKPDPVGDAIKRCKAHAKGESVFKTSVAHIFEALTEAYPTFLLIKDNKNNHQRVIDELMAKGDRERTPSLNKAAYNATELACHPDNPEGYSNCSDWANGLTLASFEEVSVENFRSWVRDKKIGEMKRKVRAAKQANKQAAKPLKAPFAEGDFPALAYVFKHCADDEHLAKSTREALALLNEQASETLAAMNVVVA